MKKKISKLSLNKKSVSNLNQLKGGLRNIDARVTVGDTCEGATCLGTCNPTHNESCLPIQCV